MFAISSRTEWTAAGMTGVRTAAGTAGVKIGSRAMDARHATLHGSRLPPFVWQTPWKKIAMLPGVRGHGHGTQAQRLLVRYLFAHTTVHRIEAATEVGNIAEQRALEKIGFAREGVMRGIGWRDGAWRDGVTYSLLRTDGPARVP